jgi:hypothetical protein
MIADDFRVVRCEHCGSVPASTRPAMTAYYFDGEIGSENDPNKPVTLCQECMTDYVDYWVAMWSEYYNAVGY